MRGASLLQSVQGNLEIVAWQHSSSSHLPTGKGSVGGNESDYLVSSFRDPTTRKWSRPNPILVDGKPIVGVTGTP